MSQHTQKQSRSISATKKVKFSDDLEVKKGHPSPTVIGYITGMNEVQEFLGAMVELAKSFEHQVRDASVGAGSNELTAALKLSRDGASLQVDAYRPTRSKDLRENVG